jgi:carboxymethylenebutenolidase
MESEIRIDTPSGPMRTFLVRPDGDGPFPAGVIFMDAPGYREALKNVARRYAQAGYLVAVPDMYAPFGEAVSIDIDLGARRGRTARSASACSGCCAG